MGVRFKVRTEGVLALKAKLDQATTPAEHALAVEVAKDTEKYVPARTKSLVNRVQVVGNRVVYPGPYARYLHEGKVMVDAATGKGPMRYVDQDGNEKIRFRKGAKLRATGRNLKISKAVHAQAQSHWFEASKKDNLEKWERYAGKKVTDGLK